jgi:HEAT repeat protein
MNHSGRLQELIVGLRNKNEVHREHARNALVCMCSLAVEPLISVSSNRDEHLRWEACKALGTIADPRAAAALVEALRDENFEIQWLAAEGLIALGQVAVVPLRRALEVHFSSVYLRQGAHHVLHALERSGGSNNRLLAVLDALRFLVPKSSVALAARHALRALDHHAR